MKIMKFLSQTSLEEVKWAKNIGDFHDKKTVILLIVVIFVIGAVIALIMPLLLPLKSLTKTKSSTFTLNVGEEARIVYDFYIDAEVHKKHVYLIWLKSVDTSLKSVGISAIEFVNATYQMPDSLKLGEQITAFVTEEGGAYVRLIGINEAKATFETWFEIGEPYRFGPIAPTEIIIRKKEVQSS